MLPIRKSNGKSERRSHAVGAEVRVPDLGRAFGRFANNVQRQAMNQCYRFSRVCRPVGCQF